MNPNSRNQMWSRWTWTVYPGRRVAVPFEPIKRVIANFARSWFGQAGQMRITEKLDHYIIDLRTEGKPAHDPSFVAMTVPRFETFFVRQFGNGTRVQLTGPKIEAGHFQDGRPSDQLIILPSLKLDELLKG